MWYPTWYPSWIFNFQNIHSTLVHTCANNIGHIGHDEGKEDICLSKQRKLMKKNHNLCYKKNNFNIFHFTINFHICFVFEKYFHLIITKFIVCFHIRSLMFFLHTTHIYYLHNFKKSHKFVKFMICEIKQTSWRNKKEEYEELGWNDFIMVVSVC
jgi:hypothetical protein